MLGMRIENVHYQLLKIGVRKAAGSPTEREIILGIIKIS